MNTYCNLYTHSSKHHKFFSSHLALPLFVNNKFIELQPGGYFVCSRPDLAPLVPSAQTPSHLRHLYHQVVEFSHAALPLGWTNSPRIWTSVMSVVAATLRRHGMRTLLYVDDLLIRRLQLLRGRFSGAPNHRGDTSLHGHRPRATQGLLRHTFADPARSSGLQHLHHWQRSSTGSREEVLSSVSSSARTAFPGFQESAPGRLRPPSALRRRSHLVLVSSSLSSLSPPRGVQLPATSQARAQRMQITSCIQRF